ncbi:MAG: spore coat protein CotJB [Clostridia bacterium]|nr:spore coat protein CotJB [Clostridia bacterium]
MNCTKKSLLKEIQTLSFVLNDTALYLDGHPTDRRAIAYYNTKNEKLAEMMAEYEENYGPLTQSGFYGTEKWTWIAGPWPWKYEANADME